MIGQKRDSGDKKEEKQGVVKEEGADNEKKLTGTTRGSSRESLRG